MENKSALFNLVSAQRYFHLIAFKATGIYQTATYWENSKMSQIKENQTVHDNIDFTIEHKKVKTDIPFHGGEKDYSLNGDGNEPFVYDLFVIHLKATNQFIFGFPFKYFAKIILKNLLDSQILKKGSFIKCDLTKLIKLNKENVSTDENFVSYFSALELRMSGDTNISTVILDGDNPLDSLLYKTYFEERINSDQCLLDRCSLKCETRDILPKTKSNIHLDAFGNYKLYIHGSGNNIFTIPYLFRSLDQLNCLNTTITNPITKLQDEQVR